MSESRPPCRSTPDPFERELEAERKASPPGTWSSEEIAERNRQALMPKTPPGVERKLSRKEPAFPPPPPPSPKGVRAKRPPTPRRRFSRHQEPSDEEKPLEPRVPWTAFFSFMAGVCTALMGGSLVPVGVALAFVSVVLGLVSVLGFMRWRRRGGLALALAGMVLGIGFSLLHTSAAARGRESFPFLYAWVNRTAGGSVNYHLEQVEADFKRLDLALMQYNTENGKLPPHAQGNLGANSTVSMRSASFGVPTFKVHVMAYDQFNALTTPVAYIGRYPRDPFAPALSATYGYRATLDSRFALLLSPGPNNQYDLDPETDFVPGDEDSRNRLLALRWDPTNGTRSGGDLWYIVAAPRKQKIDPATGLPTVPGIPMPPMNPVRNP